MTRPAAVLAGSVSHLWPSVCVHGATSAAGVPSEEEVRWALFQTLAANNMRDGVHVRLTLTRGLKTSESRPSASRTPHPLPTQASQSCMTPSSFRSGRQSHQICSPPVCLVLFLAASSMNPLFNVYGCCLIILPEHKPVGGVATYDNDRGIKLITASNRRNPPQCVDSKIHHNNLVSRKTGGPARTPLPHRLSRFLGALSMTLSPRGMCAQINNILPKIQANYAGAQDALMLDLDGFVSETNATNLFMVKDGVLLTPHADHCLPGITRQTVIDLAPTIGR